MPVIRKEAIISYGKHVRMCVASIDCPDIVEPGPDVDYALKRKFL